MSEDQLFLGLDSGTQGTKAIVLSRERGSVLASAFDAHRIIENNEGRREQDPVWWIQACMTVLQEVLEQVDVSRKRICAIGVSGQQHGMVPLDKGGEVIRPAKLWCDTETSRQCDEITQKVGGPGRAVELTGNAIAEGFTASKILWMKQNEPKNYDRLETVLLPHDYINFWLTGEKKSEFGDASGTAYFDVTNRKWSATILRAIDPSGKLDKCLPELIQSHAPVGTIKSDIAERFQLPTDVLVSAGGGDNMMAAIGTGNVRPGIVTTSIGTSGTIYSYADHAKVDPTGEMAAFCSSSGGWLPLVCTMNVTVSTELTREVLGLDLADFNKHAASAPLGSEGIILLPYFNGERTPPLPHATAAFLGLTSANYNRANLSRASMEGATLGLRYGLDVLKRQGIDPTEIRLVGGGANSPLWRQMVADVFDCHVVCPEMPEAAALGAALQALWCYVIEKEGGGSLEEITDQFVSLDETTRSVPHVSHVSRYAKIYERYLKLNQALNPKNRGR